MPKYQLQIFSGNACELCWKSLTDTQAKYWKDQSEERVRDYVLCFAHERGEEFSDVPKNAHIKGEWYELDDVWHEFGPVDGDCTLVEINKKGKETEVWTCDLSELTGKDRGKVAKLKKPKLKSRYILVSASYEKASFSYDWNDVGKKPKPSDFTPIRSPDDLIVWNVLLFGKSADESDEDSESKDFEAQVVLATKLFSKRR